MDGVSSAKGHRIPSILSQKFSTVFSPESKRLSAEKNYLLISYVLVLTLYADEFRTDPTDIAKDLRMSSIKLRVHYEHLGCKLSRQDSLLLFTLPLPLQFPTVRQKRRR
jgi:DNA-directed RNA polymerase I subunit RPA49